MIDPAVQPDGRFRIMFDTAAVGIGMLSLDRKFVEVNLALCTMFGVDREDIIGKSPIDFTYIEDLPASTLQFESLSSGKESYYWGERRYVRKNGEFFWAQVTMTNVRDRNGAPLYMVGMLIDIDEQKKTLAELQQSEARFRAMFDNTSVGIALTDLNRQIIQVNEAAARITGYSQDELMKINPIDLSLPEDRLIGQEALKVMVRGERDGMTVERRFIRKNGSLFWGRVTYSLVRNVAGVPQYLIGLIEDINDQKLAAEKLAQQELEYLHTLEKRVEERTHELSETNLRLVQEIEQRELAEAALAAKAAEEAVRAERTRLAHDLHDAVTQTLFSASLIAEVLPELWDVNPEEARKSNEELRQLTRGALAEMRTLLFELRPAALTQARFSDLIQQLSDAVIGRARIPVNLVVKGESELPPEIKISYYRVAQECLNNIVKYSHASNIDIMIRLGSGQAHMEIIDNGIGFDQKAIKPTSLGMHIMRDRADAIHASLQILSVPGNGTRVKLDWNDDSHTPILD
jgi:PAS domain S-box-containing protein